MTVLLVANDFPPKVGGIQTYLGELWRRLPADDVAVLTTAYPGAAAFDAQQAYRIERVRERVLLPAPALARRINEFAEDVGARAIVLDPPLPLGQVARRLERPYAVVLHGGVSVLARAPVVRRVLAPVLAGAGHLICAGGFPAAEVRRLLGDLTPPITVVTPGVDVEHFRPLSAEERAKARAHFGLPENGRIIVSVSRLVPRKGMDVLIDAAAALAATRPDLVVAIGGGGRDRGRLARRIDATGAPVVLLGRVPPEDLPRLYGCADVFAMLCRNRWKGLEQEGFGIVFAEAAACGVPQVAGDSGGAAEAVDDGVTGIVVRRPKNVPEAVAALTLLLDDDDRRREMGAAARARAEAELSYDRLAQRLESTLRGLGA